MSDSVCLRTLVRLCVRVCASQPFTESVHTGLASLARALFESIVTLCARADQQASTVDMLDWGVPSPVVAPRPSVRASADGRCHRPLPLSVLGGRDYYVKMQSVWLKLTAINVRKPELGSWLEASTNGPATLWGAGCRVCREACIRPSTWASFGVRGKALQTSTIKRHTASRHHMEAIGKMLGVDVGHRASPHMDEFMKIMVDRRKGLSHGSTSEVGGRHKACRMTWCLAEAARDIERDHIRQSTSVVLHQDARDQLFLVRLAAVSQDMKVMRGVLGIAKNFGTTSDDICKATVGILDAFCTPRLSPPRVPSALASSVDGRLLQHLKSKIEMFDADAATDEQRAGHVLQGKSASASMSSIIFPNLKLVVRDRTHASTRHLRSLLSSLVICSRLSCCPHAQG